MDSREFGTFIATVRKETGMTQAQLAEKLSVTDKAISRWETGKGYPDISTLRPLSDALGISVMELLQSERIVEEQVPLKDAGDAFDGMVDIVTYQRAMERRNLIIAVLVPILVVVCVFLIDSVSPYGVFLVYLPCACLLLGIVLIVYSFHRKRHHDTCAVPFILGICALAYAVLAFLFPTILLLAVFLLEA